MSEQDPLSALPELSPPPQLDASVLELSLAVLEHHAAEDPPLRQTPAVSGFEVFVHGAIAVAYLVYAADAAIGLLLAF